MPTTSAIDIAALTVRYGGTLAVHDLDLRTDAGETVALLGPNGAGKSSTVNAALGLFRPTSGRVSLLGREPSAAVAAGGVGAMLQHGGLPSESRVGEVLRLIGSRYARPWAKAVSRHMAGRNVNSHARSRITTARQIIVATTVTGQTHRAGRLAAVPALT